MERIAKAAIIVGACAALFASQRARAQDKPSDEQLRALVKQVVGGIHSIFGRSPIAVAGSLKGVGTEAVAELESFSLVRWGEPRPEYLPVEVCARVQAHNRNVQVLAQAGMARLERKVFDVRLRMRITKNDFGEWRAEMIPMDGSERSADALCSLDSTRLSQTAPTELASPTSASPNRAVAEGVSLTIEESAMAEEIRDGEPVNVGSRYPSWSRNIACYVRVSRERSGQHIEFVWVQPDGLERVRTSSVLQDSRPQFYQFASSTFRPRAPLQKGAWRVDIYVDGVLARTLEFDVF
jgi:hypothetical protein